MSQVHTYELEVPSAAVDANGHANNVEFVRWMQEAAISHSNAAGCTRATADAGAAWVVRSHRIEYKRLAFAGERLQVLTWVADFRRAFSLRKYRFRRVGDGAVVAEGETDWAYVDTASGRPKSVPPHIQAMFEVVAEPGEPADPPTTGSM